MLAALFITSTATRASDDILVKMDGMTCEMCVKTIKKKFKKQDSVENITGNFDEQNVTIDVKEGHTLSDETIKEIVDWAGFDLIEINRL